MSVTRREVIAGSTAAVGLSACGGLPPAMAAAPPPAIVLSGRETLSLNDGWRFHEGDIAFPPIRDHEAAYANGKAGNATGAAAADHDDSDWAVVTVPHDWALGQPVDPAMNIDQGFRRRGIGWYRRTFALDEADRDRHLELRFDGIATHATVWINGTLARRNFSGFTGFTIDLGAFAAFGDDLNTIAVRVDADATEGWWYEGAGLYRHCWLTKRDAVHIATDGVHCDPRYDGGAWRVPVAAAIVNTRATAAQVVLETVLTDLAGRRIAAATPVALPAGGTVVAHATLSCADPARWSPDAPVLHRLTTRIVADGRSIDAVETPIGFRTLRFDARDGFFLNDRPLKIRGVCVHQDHAGVGVAVPDSLWDYRLRRLQAMGANAIRCAHNPPAAALLDAADRLGMLVMDEHRELSGADDTLDRLGWLVRRDRNHPSVILWSLCNEESLQSSATGVAMIRRMKAVVRALDDSRPITAALNGAMFAQPNIADELDVVGFNYGTDQYDRYHATFPDRPLLSSEDTSAYMTRGVLRTDRAAHVLADDDSEHAAWGRSHGEAWRSIATRPFMAGGFAWTGFDYRGEPTPFEWPSTGASFGAMDLCGFAKSAFHIRRALWTDDAPVLELSPHWTWPGREGMPIPILVITNADRVVLRLNGQIVGDLTVDRFTMARTTLAYAPGRLEAIAYRRGRPVAHRRVETTGRAVALHLTPDRPAIRADGRDTVPITLEALDARGRPCPDAQHLVRLSIDGGTIAGVGNGDPNSHESDLPAPGGHSAARHLFNGLAQVLVQTRGRGRMTITAQADGLAPTSLSLNLIPGTMPSVAPRDGRQSLTEWRQAPPSPTPPPLDRVIAEGDMNSWAWIKPGAVETGGADGRYILFRTEFTPRRRTMAAGGTIVFARIVGAARLWLDGQPVRDKTDPGPGRLVLPLRAGPGPHILQILFDTGGRPTPFGLPGSVTVG
ncbi:MULTISPECIES: beta-galactosidase GalA [unclassified Sphingomonas]|uniref:beta-galactosidase GalA n=1 Tax=unclassified Sphingomonas TaxID=196159 RepID=UPI0006F5C08F|nr:MULTISPECIES: beta-galactosidase GalA [unclassified Sphingomonas]KQM61410.1 hypothetical protein ASE65_07685 [Sphingomonas sp. Leaf16]KQN12505.1 hypothetical protein ASE81_08695 [Sphingomonas sp. Leaf29]KQN18985.1 hypothetical protein ASE83_08620 [Sphingomonas sp. Leaf32]